MHNGELRPPEPLGNILHQLASACRDNRRSLAGRLRVTATFKRADGRTLHVRKATRPEPGQQAIFDALGIHSSAGGTQKLIV